MFDSGPDGSSGTGSASASEAGNELAGCSNPLGSVWNETESDEPCASTWTRQGATPMFAAVQASPCHVTAMLTIAVSGSSVSAYWTSSSNGDDCNYIGTLSADCSSASGVYTCTGADAASGTWNATIKP